MSPATASTFDLPPGAPRRRRFRIEVGTLMAGMVIVQALLLIALALWGGHRLLTTVGETAHEAEHARVETEVRAFLSAATGAVRALAAAPQHASADAEDREAELIWTLMSESPALDALYFVEHDGHAVVLQRHPSPVLRRIRQEGAAWRETADDKPRLGELALPPAERYASTASRRGEGVDFHALPWFRAASAAGPAGAWSDAHQLAYSREQGVSFAVPDHVPDVDGKVHGVAVGDVSLRHLAELVDSFSHAGAGESAVLDRHGRVLARSDRPAAGQAVLGDRGTAALPSAGADGLLVRVTDIPGTPWRLVSWLPEDAVVGGLRKLLLAGGGVLVVTLGLALGVSLWLSRRITGPVEVLAQVARRIGRLELDNLPRVESSIDEIARLDRALGESARSLRAFRKFVPPGVVDTLVRHGRPLEPGGELAEVTAMFTDIEGFTGIAAVVPPHVLVPQLTEYFNAAARIVVAHGGTIDKYIGDGMMVLWGAPQPEADAPVRACGAALALHAAFDAMNEDWAARGLPRLKTRIGIHTGVAVVGVLGSSERLSFTAFGDTINVASRIEGMNKDFGTRSLVSGQTAAAIGKRFVTRALGESALRGHGGRWMLHELVDQRPVGQEAGACTRANS